MRDLLLVFGATAGALAWLVRPNPFDITRPAAYSQDALAHGLLVKTTMEVGWYPVFTPWLGAPFGSSLFDYPFSDGLNLLLIHVLALFSSDWVVVANLFYLAGFFLSGASAYAVLRHLRVEGPLAIAGALLFAFLPYHFLRREHLLLVSYPVVPFGIYLASLAWNGAASMWRSPRHAVLLALAVVAVGSGGVYYAFFSAVLVGVAACARLAVTRTLREAAMGALLAAGIATAVLLNIAPSLVYWAANGTNSQVAVRTSTDSEIYGLRLTQLLLPQRAHRVEALRDVTARYERGAPLVNENVTSALGSAGAAGLVIVGVVGFRRLCGIPAASHAMSFLVVMATTAFLLGTSGGAGALFAFFVSPMIRAYNRISVVLGFVALAALLVGLGNLVTRSGRHLRPVRLAAIGAVLAIAGVLDQTPVGAPPQEDGSFESDRDFVRAAEVRLPLGTMVWQLPYQPFPESYWVHHMALYGPLRGYLNSTALRWSYGAMKGRDADRWIHALADRPLEVQLGLAARSGFGAIYVDRRGFVDGAHAAERLLRDRLGPPLVESKDGELAMYRLEPTGTSPLPLGDVQFPIDSPIRFDEAELTGLVKQVAGISGFEPWGRWTVGPAIKVELSRNLPLHFVLRIETATALGPSVGTPLTARVGNVERHFIVGSGSSVVELPFDHTTATSAIEIDIPDPRSPRELGMNTDERKLGIGLRSITVLPAAGLQTVARP